MKEAERMVCADIWTSDNVYECFQYLCLECSPRFIGQEGHERAADYIFEKLREFGLDDVQRLEIDVPVWKRGDAQLQMISPVERGFPCIALPLSPPCDLEAEAVDAGFGSDMEMKQYSDDMKGKMTLVESANPPDGFPLHRLQKYLSVLENNAAAFLFMKSEPGVSEETGSLAYDPTENFTRSIPGIGLSYEAGRELRYYMNKGPVKLKLRMNNELKRGKAANIIGERKAPAKLEKPAVLLTAHYDGHDISQGADDNASGTSIVLEAARVLKHFAPLLKTDVVFALVTAEELGLLGSYALRDHLKKTGKKIRMVLNADSTAASPNLRLLLQGMPDALPAFKRMIAQLPSDVKTADHIVPYSDHFPFFLDGIPSAFMASVQKGRGWGHTRFDTFDKIDRFSLQNGAANLARIAGRIAAAGEWNFKGPDRNTINRLLKEKRIKKLLEFEEL